MATKKDTRYPYCKGNDLEWLLDGLQDWYDCETILKAVTYIDPDNGRRYWRDDLSDDAIFVICDQNVAV